MIKLSRTKNIVKLEMSDPPSWAKFVGIMPSHTDHLPSGELLVRFIKTPAGTPDRQVAKGFENRLTGMRAFQFAGRDAKAKVPEIFGMTEATLGAAGDDFIDVLVPAERVPLKQVHFKNSAKVNKAAMSRTLAPIKEGIKAMANESPPPGFTPAIPLREAIDTINTYKVVEGDAIELMISKRGRLKVKYEYGG